jgi:PDZ domain-containing secreted protein
MIFLYAYLLHWKSPSVSVISDDIITHNETQLEYKEDNLNITCRSNIQSVVQVFSSLDLYRMIALYL